MAANSLTNHSREAHSGFTNMANDQDGIEGSIEGSRPQSESRRLEEKEDKYPHGFVLCCIVTSLLLSVFLVDIYK